MNLKTRVRIISYLAFFIIFLIIWSILHFTFNDLENPYKGMISAVITAIVAPRINIYQAQSGKKIQLKWLFLKKPINMRN
jgi:hypothetical protein